MKKITFIAIVLVMVIAACKPVPNKEKVPPAKSQILYNEVLELHDEAMPKLGTLMGYQKTLKAKIDSLNTYLKTHKGETASDLKQEYEALLAQLKAAEDGMNSWMDHFEPDPKLPTEADLEAYFAKEKVKAQKMKDEMFAALDSAKAKIKE